MLSKKRQTKLWEFAAILTTCSVSLVASASGQSTTTVQNSTTAVQNPTARTYVVQALEAMGAPEGVVPHQTVQATGIVVDSRDPQMPRQETLWAKNTTRFRVDWENAKGKHSYAIDNGNRSALHSSGVDHPPSYDRVLRARPNFFPFASLLAEWSSPHTTITLLHDKTINGVLAHTVCISVNQIGNSTVMVNDPHITETTFYIDAQSYLVLRISNEHPPGLVTIRQLPEHTDFANYQKVGSMTVPFQQTTYVGGHQVSTLTLTGVQFDVPMQDAFFKLQGASHAD